MITLPKPRLGKQDVTYRKIQKVLNTSLEDPEVQSCLQDLESIFTPSTTADSAYINHLVEEHVINTNKHVLDAVKGVEKDCVTIHEQIENMKQEYQKIDQNIKESMLSIANLLSQSSHLHANKERIMAKKRIIERFLSKFTLSDEHSRAITSNSAVDKTFFDAFERVQGIIEESSILMMFDEQIVGSDIIQKMTGYQESAFEKLKVWISAEARSLKREVPEITPLMKYAMTVAKRREGILQSCVEEVSSVRSSVISSLFLTALTKGGVDGTPRAIELNAHDSVRYIGDMLAWVHQTCASEKDVIESLFTSEDQNLVMRVVNRNTSGIIRPLKLRIEQSLVSQTDPIIVYRVSDILSFYDSIVIKIVGGDSELTNMLKGVKEFCNNLFFDILNVQASHLLKDVREPEDDLQPVPEFFGVLTQLKSILTVLEMENSKPLLEKLSSTLLDPLLQLTSISSSTLGKQEQCVYIINCMNAFHELLSQFMGTSEWQNRVFERMNMNSEILIKEMCIQMQKVSEIYQLLDILNSNPSEPMAYIPESSTDVVKSCMQKFDAFLIISTPDTPVLDVVTLISSVKVQRDIIKKSCKSFLEEYERLYNAVMDPRNKYEFPSTIMKRSVGEVEVLLGVDLSESD